MPKPQEGWRYGYCILVWRGRQADGFLSGGVLYQEPEDPDSPSTNWWPWQPGRSPEQLALEARLKRVRAVYGSNYQVVWNDWKEVKTTMLEELSVEQLEQLAKQAEAETSRTDLDTVELGWVQQLANAAKELAQFRKQRHEKAAAGGCTCQEQAAAPQEAAPQ